MQPEPLPQLRPSVRIPDGLSADELRKSLDGIPSTLQGMRSPMGETSRSECVAGMDMLNDMFQRQARRLESQLYQRAQDQRNIELAQQQAKLAMAKLRQLEQVHQEQVVRLQQGNHSLRKLQQHVHEFEQNHEEALEVCSALHQDVSQLRDYASKAHVSQALMGSPLSSARSLSQDVVDMTDVSLPMAAAASLCKPVWPG
ncbi:hypothetical protein AB1Y20_001926 [Prymnesium parvum]|uniref:Uncharacterized protein n=1 Tax=Prymnesium parvum TaxID=97485 RepID=A0AB34J9L8_PRYPA